MRALEFLTDHVTFKLRYNQIYQLKTTIYNCTKQFCKKKFDLLMDKGVENDWLTLNDSILAQYFIEKHTKNSLYICFDFEEIKVD